MSSNAIRITLQSLVLTRNPDQGPLCALPNHEALLRDSMLAVSWSSSEHFTRGAISIWYYPLEIVQSLKCLGEL
ncbi:hypothetical protein VNO77_04315 [Canavalia gladiata]|uniref:Uncharacterized protein n=1 Tax=Canavalia gladiata TaxID=3824 RepID=A0AAN9R8Y5_CANGL